MPKAVKIICIALLIIGLLSFAYPVLAQGRGGPQSNYCKENIGNCEYPGECHDYRDSNNDGHCDRIVYSSGTASNTPAAQTTTTTNNGASSPASTTTASGSSTTGTAGTPGNAQSNGSRYNFLVLLATVVQHELVHLDGGLFIDNLSRLKRERVVKKFTKAARFDELAAQRRAERQSEEAEA